MQSFRLGELHHRVLGGGDSGGAALVLTAVKEPVVQVTVGGICEAVDFEVPLVRFVGIVTATTVAALEKYAHLIDSDVTERLVVILEFVLQGFDKSVDRPEAIDDILLSALLHSEVRSVSPSQIVANSLEARA
jgi:hypothetical protein